MEVKEKMASTEAKEIAGREAGNRMFREDIKILLQDYPHCTDETVDIVMRELKKGKPLEYILMVLQDAIKISEMMRKTKTTILLNLSTT
jgi:hypothetical protein